MIVLDLLVKYWTLIVAVTAVILWLIRQKYTMISLEKSIKSLEKQFTEIQDKMFVTNSVCMERRTEITNVTAIEFRHGAEQFKDVKDLISRNDTEVQSRLQEIRQILMNQIRT